MASRKKESEGIALLSIYGDDEDDDMEEQEQEDIDNDEQTLQQQQQQQPEEEQPENPQNDAEFDTLEDDSVNIFYSNSNNYSSSDRMIGFDSANGNTPPISAENFGTSSSPRPLQTQLSVASSPSLPPLPPAQQQVRSRKGTLTIVDYGHDEGALSPEAEEGEIVGVGRVTFGAELQTANGTPSGRVQGLTPNTRGTPPHSSEQFDPSLSDPMNYESNELEPTELDEALKITEDENKDMNPLEKFLPLPPKAKCSDELQEKIAKFLLLKKKTGRSFNSEVRNRKDYRNPDFLLHAVTYQDIDQIGSCFSKDVFDPHGYDKSDYYDEIEADLKREMERKEQEKKKSQKVEFLSGGTQPGTVVPTPKISLPIPAVPTVAGGGQHPVSSAVDVGRDGRQNKKSKWDKVDVQDSVASAGAQAALLSAANAGTGYTAFAQQRRREVEERRSSDRKLDRRS